MVRRDALARLAAAGRGRLSAPRAPKLASAGPSAVTLRWAAPKRGKPAAYQILRNGRLVGRTAHRSFTDRKVRPGHTYRYAIRAVDKHGRRGLLSHAVRVKVPLKGALPGSGGLTPPIAPVQPGPGPAPITDPLTAAHVERLFWRAGFGPTSAQRAYWTGRGHGELVDWFLNTVPTPDRTIPRPLTSANADIDPLASADDLVVEWLDAMVRDDNPLPQRLTFFWHRHWAVSIDDGIPNQWLRDYRDRLRALADPQLSFRTIAYEMSTADAAMMMYLNGNQNLIKKPNENYAREFMELFCLGPTGPDGAPNYVQADVAGLALAFTGWVIQADQMKPNYGLVSFAPSRFDNTSDKTFLGQTIAKLGRAATAADGPATVGRAIDVVLAHPNHAQFLIRKLWAEFIASPIPQATLDDLVARYRGSGYALRPVLRGILTHPLIFESLGEPNLVKPPVVYLVGLLRALGAPMKGNAMRAALDNMQQRPYRPPNVAGWEGGLSWLNSNTVQARFDAVVRVQYFKYSNATGGYPGQSPPTIPAESAQATFDRAHTAAGSPWLSDGTRAQLMAYANAAPVTSDAQRRQRFYTLQALMLGGPDGQVM